MTEMVHAVPDGQNELCTAMSTKPPAPTGTSLVLLSDFFLSW